MYVLDNVIKFLNLGSRQHTCTNRFLLLPSHHAVQELYYYTLQISKYAYNLSSATCVYYSTHCEHYTSLATFVEISVATACAVLPPRTLGSQLTILPINGASSMRLYELMSVLSPKVLLYTVYMIQYSVREGVDVLMTTDLRNSNVGGQEGDNSYTCRVKVDIAATVISANTAQRNVLHHCSKFNSNHLALLNCTRNGIHSSLLSRCPPSSSVPAHQFLHRSPPPSPP